MNIFTILGILFIVVSVVGLLIISAKYGIKSTLDIYTGREKKKVLSRIEARKGLIGAEQTAELVEKYSALEHSSARTTFGSAQTTGSLTQDLFKNPEKVDELLGVLMENNSATTSNLEVDESISLNYREEEYEEEQTGVLDSDEKETLAEKREQRRVNAEIKKSLSLPTSAKGVFQVVTIYDNIEL